MPTHSNRLLGTLAVAAVTGCGGDTVGPERSAGPAGSYDLVSIDGSPPPVQAPTGYEIRGGELVLTEMDSSNEGTWTKSIDAPELPSPGFGVDRSTSGTYAFDPPNEIRFIPYERAGLQSFNLPFEGRLIGAEVELVDPRGAIPDRGLEARFRRR